MKNFVYTSCLLLLALLGARNGTAQVNAETRMGNGGSYWTLGLNGGFAWQDSDIRARLGGGWGFYFGSSIYNRPNSFFSVDWRFRYMNTYTFGQNARDKDLGNRVFSSQYNFTYDPATEPFAHNHFTILHDLSLELRLNFEELRRRTNIMLAVYGGVGVGLYNTWLDQRNLSGNQYNYNDASINYAGSDNSIVQDIVGLRDNEYETAANPSRDPNEQPIQATLTPSVGIELGYWFSPHFALAVGHRTTFTLREDFDGVRINNGNGNANPIHHYTALMLHWRIFGGRSRVPCPEVEFDLPIRNGLTYVTEDPNVFIRAYVRNVNNNEITYTVNGVQKNFLLFNSTEQKMEGNLSLVPGENRVIIRAKNSCGSETRGIVINYKPRSRVVTPKPAPPVVRFIQPQQSPVEVTSPILTVRANVLNVANSSGLRFTINNVANSNFSYSAGNFVANTVTLNPGQNVITLTGTNADGSDSQTMIVNYIQRQELPLPVVNITQPARSPSTATSDRVRIQATILHVVGSNNVQFTINGRRSSNFRFSGTSFIADNVDLQQGANTITITGTNAQGTDAATVIINYLPRVVEQPPVVNIVAPRPNPYRTQNNRETVSATILNVDGRSNIQCTVNGRNFTAFNFSGTTFTLPNLVLQPGANRIIITGRNRVGQDVATQIISYEPARQSFPRPVVTITSPAQNPYTSTMSSIAINATILHVASANDVQFTVNGVNNRNFTLTRTNFLARSVALRAGNNTITITGRNAQGQDSKSTVIIYRAPVREPSVVITNPNQNPYTSPTQTTTINATILNVDSRNNVTFTLNGRTNTNFSFSGTSFVANNVNLNAGNNVVVITGTNASGTARATTTLVYQFLEPPHVRFTSPNQTPFSIANSRYNIRAVVDNVDRKSDVTFNVNGQNSTAFDFVNNQLTANNVVLNPGPNTITVTGRNRAGQDSKSTVIVYRERIQPPTVTITIPNRNPTTVTTATTNIAATITNMPSRSGVTFTVNGRANTNFSFSGTNFTANGVSLVEGRNTFVISAINEGGRASQSTVVVYEVPVAEPTVVITNPNQNPFTTNQMQATINATIRNVSSRNDVTFTVNGRSSTSFTFNGTQFTATNVNLANGNNTFVITGRNASGTAQASTTIVYRVPKPPYVTITNPQGNPFNTQVDRITINATIDYVYNQSDVTFKVNGRASNNFTLTGRDFVSNNMVLNAGNNTIEITGRNAAGQHSASKVIIYTPFVPRPVVNITTPSSSSTTTPMAVTNIVARVQNVTSKSGIAVTVNGRRITNFGFVNGTVTATNVTLSAGNNSIVVTGTNSAGSATDSKVIVYTSSRDPRGGGSNNQSQNGPGGSTGSGGLNRDGGTGKSNVNKAPKKGKVTVKEPKSKTATKDKKSSGKVSTGKSSSGKVSTGKSSSKKNVTGG